MALKISLKFFWHASPDVSGMNKCARRWNVEKATIDIPEVASSAFRMQQDYLTLVSAISQWRRSHTCHVREASSWQLAGSWQRKLRIVFVDDHITIVCVHKREKGTDICILAQL